MHREAAVRDRRISRCTRNDGLMWGEHLRYQIAGVVNFNGFYYDYLQRGIESTSVLDVYASENMRFKTDSMLKMKFFNDPVFCRYLDDYLWCFFFNKYFIYHIFHFIIIIL